MARGTTQLVLAGLLIPLAVIVFIIGFFVIEDTLDVPDEVAFLLTGLLTWVMVICYWLLLWRRTVNWTRQRIVRTVSWTIGAPIVIASVMGALYYASAVRHERRGWGVSPEGYVLSGAALTPVVWLVATVVIWSETKAERGNRLKSVVAAKLVCPTCNYNLAGLTEARCPECGTQYTLDQLLAAQSETPADLSTVG